MLGGLTNEEFIKRFNQEQKHGSGHGMTCGGKKDSCRQYLIAIERNGKVILVCPLEDCDYEQTFIPEKRPQGFDWREDH